MPSIKKFRILKFKSKPILTARGISKTISNRLILRKIDFEINKGEIFGLLGPNGAGKSVTFNVLLGIMKADQGNVFVEGGIKEVSDHFLKVLRKLCDEKNILLILDEVQCGIGRTGDFFAFEKSGIIPDIVPIAKGIGGGFPLGACLLTKKVAVGMSPGSHGSTFGGNPLAMAVGNGVLDIILKDGFLENVKKISEYFDQELVNLVKKYPKVILEIRGRGLLKGLKLLVDNSKFIEILMKYKMLTVKAEEQVVRLFPPLIVKKKEIDEAISKIGQACNELS